MFDFKQRRSLQRIAWIDQPAIHRLSAVYSLCTTAAENFGTFDPLLDHASRQGSAMLQARMPKAVPGALLIELRPSPAISVASVTLTANSASYRCRMPSASATVIVANDGRYLYRYVADHDFSLKSTGPSLLQSLVSRKGVIRFCPALRSCRRTNQSSNYFLQDH